MSSAVPAGASDGLVMGRVVAAMGRHGSRTALVCEGEALSYTELTAEANRLADGLLRLGVGAGDRFAFLLPNGTRIVTCYLACATSGIVGVPLATRTTTQDLVHQLRDSGAVALLYAAEFASTVAAVHEQVPGLRWWVCEEPGTAGLALPELLQGAGDEPPATEPSEDDPFCLMYTGGTTGPAKAVVQTHRMWAACVLDTVEQLGVTGADRHAVVLPMTHAAWFTAAAHLSVGATTHVQRRWDPTALLGLVETERLTTLHLIPTLLGDVLAAVDGGARRDVSSVRLLSLAGAPIPVEMYRRACALFGDVVGNIYGMTEAAGPVTWIMPPEMDESWLASAGRVGRFVELVVDDGTGSPARAGESGEILLRGLQVTPGYLNRTDEATTAAFRGGWFHTGDVGRLDRDGLLFVVDRMKDMIKTGGMNVYPHEVEEILHGHPAVVEAAVVGVPDPRWMETVVAVVALDGATPCDPGDLVALCRARLPGYKVPTAVHVVDALPRTAFGKVDKRALQQRLSPGEPSSAAGS